MKIAITYTTAAGEVTDVLNWSPETVAKAGRLGQYQPKVANETAQRNLEILHSQILALPPNSPARKSKADQLAAAQLEATTPIDNPIGVEQFVADKIKAIFVDLLIDNAAVQSAQEAAIGNAIESERAAARVGIGL